jgi:hypothetical protein
MLEEVAIAVPADKGRFVALLASSWIIASWDDADVDDDSTRSRRPSLHMS